MAALKSSEKSLDSTMAVPVQAEVIIPPTTKRGLKSRHGQMIALGGTIGTALFVGSGKALNMGGPVFLFVAYTLMSFIVFGIITATTEMSSYLPVPGCSMSYYAKRFFSPSLGFALGWMYWYIFAVTPPAEIVAAGLIVQYWDSPVPLAAWITIFLVLIVALNFFSVSVYGETEFWFASLKVFGIVGLIMMAIVIILGGAPNGDRLGFRYWATDPLHEYLVPGVSGRLAAFVATTVWSIAPFAFSAELLIIAGGEMENPRKNLPTAGRRYFYRLVLFYIIGSLALSLICYARDQHLLGGSSTATSSPWAIAAKNAGIKGLDSVINAIILTSAWSAGNAYLYLASRCLYSLAMAGNAPQIFARVNRKGVPYYSVMCNSLFCLLSYMALSEGSNKVFTWLITLINTGAFQSWIAICIIYNHFRKIVDAQGLLGQLPYRSRFQPYASWVSGAILSVLLLVNGFSVFVPRNWNSSDFIVSYIGIPILAVLYFGHKFTLGRNDPWILDLKDVDMVTGLNEIAENETVEEKGPTKWYMYPKRLFG